MVYWCADQPSESRCDVSCGVVLVNQSEKQGQTVTNMFPAALIDWLVTLVA